MANFSESITAYFGGDTTALEKAAGRAQTVVGDFQNMLGKIGITIGAATIGIEELLDHRAAKAAAAGSGTPPPPAMALPVNPEASSSANGAGPPSPPTSAASNENASGEKHRPGLHRRRIGPPRPPNPKNVAPPPNPYDDPFQ